jgi:ssDNA-binding Zn-finger/Zn-ribbon topoisomerase 1
MNPTFGPVHPCPKCGAPIQYVRRHGHWDVCEDATTGGRHYCPADVPPEPATLLECRCGTLVLIRNGKRYERDGKPHVCRAKPVTTAPRKGAANVVVPL